MRVFGERKRFRCARASFAGHKPVESGDGESEPCFTRGKVRRWRPSARVGDFVRARRFAARARSGAWFSRYIAWEIGGVAQAARACRTACPTIGRDPIPTSIGRTTPWATFFRLTRALIILAKTKPTTSAFEQQAQSSCKAIPRVNVKDSSLTLLRVFGMPKS